MSKILKVLNHLAGYYNNLPEEKKILKNGNFQKFMKSDSVQQFTAPMMRKTKDFVAKTRSKASKRKGPRQSSEMTFNHPHKDFHQDS